MSIFQSRKVRIAIADAAFALVALWVGAYMRPEIATLIMQTVAIVQAPIMLVIAGIAIEDAAHIKAGTHPRSGDR